VEPGVFSKRVAAFGVDMGLIALLQVSVGGASIKFYELLCQYWSMNPVESVELFMSQFSGGFFFISYFTFCQGYLHSTAGKSLMKLQVYYGPHRTQLTLKQAYFRSLGYILSSWTYGIGFILPFFRKDKLTLHDLLCNTRVVELKSTAERNELQLELPLLASVHMLEIPQKAQDQSLVPLKKAQ
jgi:uncharacterized RDD family membrane protein YckC